MKRGLAVFLFAISTSTVVRADIVNLQIDSTQSSVTVTFKADAVIGGNVVDTDTEVDTSRLSGPASIDVGSTSSPFGSAQLQTFEGTHLDPLAFAFLFPNLGGVAVNVTSNDKRTDLKSFGAAGAVAGGLFTQNGNVLRDYGTFVATGGVNETFSFDVDNNQNFVNYQVSRTGDTLSVSGTYDFQWSFNEDVGGGLSFVGNIRSQGNFVAFGAVPEPSTAIVLAAASLLGFSIRRRR